MRHVAILVVLALTLLGCGGSDSDTDTPTTITATTAPTGSGDTTTTSQPPTTTDDSDSDSISPANCPELLGWASDSAAATNAAFAGGGTNTAGFEFTADYFQEFADRAPSEIRDDMETFADAFSNFYNTLDEIDIDFTDPSSFASLSPEQLQNLEEAAALMDSPELEEAADNIQAFFERECS